MAIAFSIVWEIEDADGDRATTTVRVPQGDTLSQYTEFVVAMAPLKDAVLTGLLTSVGLTVGVDISALTDNTALEKSDVEEIGAFQFLTDDGLPVNLNVPGLLEGLVAAGSDELDQVDADVAAVIAMMEDGLAVTGGTIIPCDVAEVDIAVVSFARENFRASGRRA